MKTQKLDWLMIFCDNLNCNQKFCQLLDQQLSAQAHNLAGIDVHKNFYLVPPENEIYHDKNNIAYLDTDLVAPDNFGYPVQICWKCATHPEVRITPQDSLSENLCDTIQMWWQEFPLEELRKYTKNPPALISNNFYFPVEWQWCVWPDIALELNTNEDLQPEQIAAVKIKLEEMRTTWNSQEQQIGIIHDWTGIFYLAPKKYEMFIDFGSTNYSALSYWLETLEKMKSLVFINKVIVKHSLETIRY